MATPLTLPLSDSTSRLARNETDADAGALGHLSVTRPDQPSAHLGGVENLNPASDLNAECDAHQYVAPAKTATCASRVKAGLGYVKTGLGYLAGATLIGSPFGIVGYAAGAAIFGTVTGAIACSAGLAAVVLIPIAGWLIYRHYKRTRPETAPDDAVTTAAASHQPQTVPLAMARQPDVPAVSDADKALIDQAIDTLKNEDRGRGQSSKAGDSRQRHPAVNWDELGSTLTSYVVGMRARGGDLELDVLASARKMHDAMTDMLLLQQLLPERSHDKAVSMAGALGLKLRNRKAKAETLVDALKDATLYSLAATSQNEVSEEVRKKEAVHDTEGEIQQGIDNHLECSQSNRKKKGRSVERITKMLKPGSELRAVYLALAKLVHENDGTNDEVALSLKYLKHTLKQSLTVLAAPEIREKVEDDLLKNLTKSAASPTFDEDIAEAEELIWRAIPPLLIGRRACGVARRLRHQSSLAPAPNEQPPGPPVPAGQREISLNTIAWQLVAEINAHIDAREGLGPDDYQQLKSTILGTLVLYEKHCKNSERPDPHIKRDAVRARTEITATKSLSTEEDKEIRSSTIDKNWNSALDSFAGAVQYLQVAGAEPRDLIEPVTTALLAAYCCSAAENGGQLDEHACREELDLMTSEVVNSIHDDEPTPERVRSRRKLGEAFQQLHDALDRLSADHRDDNFGQILADLCFMLDKMARGIESRPPTDAERAIAERLRPDTEVINEELFWHVPKLIAARTAFTQRMPGAAS